MDNQINFALIGCGHIAPRWLDVFQANSEINLVAIVDPNPEAFKELEKYSFPNMTKYTYIEEAYKKEKIDAVVIATPPPYHARYIIDAIDHGVHVLTEKPLCTTENQLKHILHAQKRADSQRIITAVNQQYRWNPRIVAIHQAVQDNLLGDIFLINSLLNQNNYHFNRWWRQQEEYISLFNWYVHVIDSMRYFLNRKPISVWANFIRPPHSKIIGYSSALINVTFENGIEWHLTANQESSAGPTTSGHTTFTMYGSKGTLLNTKNESPLLFLPDGQKIELGENIKDIDNERIYPPGWSETIQKFITSIRTGQEHPTSIRDNLWTIAIIFCAIRSFETKKIVYIDHFLKEVSKFQ
ncbi:Gfo/Idh/MocA family protein [Candidatus Harpocratesius sp.]